MTERFYVGTIADCETLRTALDLIYNFPAPPATGPYSCTPEQRATKTAQWFALSKAQRDSKQFDELWYGWSLRYADLLQEVSPGTRCGIWIPTGLSALMTDAVNRGVVFPLDQTLALLAADAAALASTPADWNFG